MNEHGTETKNDAVNAQWCGLTTAARKIDHTKATRIAEMMTTIASSITWSMSNAAGFTGAAGSSASFAIFRNPRVRIRIQHLPCFARIQN